MLDNNSSKCTNSFNLKIFNKLKYLLFIGISVFSLSFASGAEYYYQTLIDTDNNPATGCVVSTTDTNNLVKTVSGADLALLTTTYANDPHSIASEEQLVCRTNNWVVISDKTYPIGTHLLTNTSLNQDLDLSSTTLANVPIGSEIKIAMLASDTAKFVQSDVLLFNNIIQLPRGAGAVKAIPVFNSNNYLAYILFFALVLLICWVAFKRKSSHYLKALLFVIGLSGVGYIHRATAANYQSLQTMSDGTIVIDKDDATDNAPHNNQNINITHARVSVNKSGQDTHLSISINLLGLDDANIPTDNNEPVNPNQLTGFRILSAQVTQPDSSAQVTVSGLTSQIMQISQVNSANPINTSQVHILNTRTNQQLTTDVAANSYSANLSANVGDVLQLYPINSNNQVGQIISVIVQGTSAEPTLPPDPVTTAPALDDTQVTTVYDMTGFIYNPTNPADKVQFGVNPDDIKPAQASLLVGKVFDKNNQILTGVKITVKDFPQYGYTYSRADGQWDLVIDGGQTFTVNYQKDGYLPVQRKVQVKWQDFGYLPDVVMIPLDTKVSFIDLTDTSAPFQVHQSNVNTDADGSRKTTILFPAGLTAKMILADGSEQILPKMSIRATEFTIGENGPKTMPAELPPTSAYTFAADFSADEAIAAGATSVQFSDPVIVYEDNFLNFPAGAVVPVGYYDYAKSAWIAEPNGRVIKVLAINNDKAVLDVDGNGQPATIDELAKLNITDAELTEMTKLYHSDDSMWRVMHSHFSYHDYNWPFGPPNCPSLFVCLPPPPKCKIGVDDCFFWWDNRIPDNAPIEVPLKPKTCGCIIDTLSREVGEKVPVVGADFGLSYHSSRQKNTSDNRTIKRPISGVLPYANFVKRVSIIYEVLGKQITHSYDDVATIAPNQTDSYTWDGLDRYGRVSASFGCVLVGGGSEIVMPVAYYPTKEGFENSFATYPAGTGFPYYRSYGTLTLSSKVTDNSGYATACPPGLGATSTSKSKLNKSSKLELTARSNTKLSSGEPDIAPLLLTDDLGGWTIDIHHFYDVTRGVLYKGDNTTVTTNATSLKQASKIATLSYNDTLKGSFANGDLLITNGGTISRLDANNQRTILYQDNAMSINDAFISPSGKVYVSYYKNNTGKYYLAYIDNYILVNVMGVGNQGFIDNALVSTVSIDSSYKFVVDKNEQIYVVIDGNMYSFAENGFIHKVANTANWIDSVLGVDNVGNVYVSARNNGYSNNFISKIDTSGQFSSYIGDSIDYLGLTGKDSELQPEDKVKVNSSRLQFASDSKPIFSDSFLIRTLNDNNVVTTLAGDLYSANYSYPVQEHELVSAINSNSFYVGPDDNVIVQQGSNVYKIADSLPNFDGSDLTIASFDASQIYIFNGHGKHLRTVDALTGAIIYQFGYNTDGTLATITNHDGLITRIYHDHIVSPFGQITNLNYNTDGMLTKVTNPADENYQIGYDGNLMTSFTTPAGNTNTDQYDSERKLVKDTWANGGGWDVDYNLDTSSSEYTNEHVGMKSGEGRYTEYDTTKPTNYSYYGSTSLTTNYPDATTTQTTASSDHQTTATANNTSLSIYKTPDSRFGKIASYPSSLYISGGARDLSYGISKTTQLSGNSSNVVSQSNTITKCGNYHGQICIYYKQDYNYANSNWTMTTPMGKVTTVKVDRVQRPLQLNIAGIAPINFNYNSLGQLTRIATTDGQSNRALNYSYYTSGASNGYLQSETNVLNQTTSYEYDLAGRVTKQTLPDNQFIAFDYYADGTIKAITTPTGNKHTFTYTGMNDTSSYSPPLLGVQATDTNYSYNLDRQLTQINLPNGQNIALNYGAVTGKLNSVVYPNKQINYNYNGITGELASVADNSGNELAITKQAYSVLGLTQSGNINASFSFGYDYYNQLNAVSINDKPMYSYQYDNDSQLTKANDFSLSYNPANGLLANTAYNNVTTNYSYNGFADLTEVEIASNNGQSINDVIIDNQVTNDANLTLKFNINDIRVSKIIVKNFSESNNYINNNTSLDTLIENVIYSHTYSDSMTLGSGKNTLSISYRDVNDHELFSKSFNLYYQSDIEKTISKVYRYTADKLYYTDNFGNVMALDNATNTATQVTQPIVSDNSYLLAIDNAGQLYYGNNYTNTIDVYDGTNLVSSYDVTNYNYPFVTGAGNIYVEDANRDIYKLTDNGANLVYSKGSALSISNVTEDTATGGLLVTAQYAVNANDPNVNTYGYCLTVGNCINKIYSITPSGISSLLLAGNIYTFIGNSDGVVCYSDTLPIPEMIPIGGKSATTKSNLLSPMANTNYCRYAADGFTTDYPYAGDLTNVVEVLNNQLISLEQTSNYNAAYLITNPGKDNIRTDIIMANVNVPTLSATATISSNYGDMTKFDYQYDTVGRISQIYETSAGVTTTKSYQYNQEGKLAAETRDGVTTTWGYDANGNRISENGVNLATYDSQDRLTDYANKHYQYNQLGQLTQKTDYPGTTTYNYDVSGNLTRTQTANGDVIDYSIDPLNRRVGRKVNGLLTNKYLYLGQLNPVAELYADDKIKSLFIYAEKSNVPSAMQTYDENGALTGKYRIISNHLGSVVKVIDVNSDEVVQAIDYDAWGNVLSDSNPSFQPFYFAGGIYDQATQLTRFGARDYDAETGRWTAKDPIGFGGGLISLYDYVGGDPVNNIDPSGKFINIIIGAAVGGTASFVGTLWGGGTFSDALVSGAWGAVGGALAGATFGLSAPLAIGLSTIVDIGSDMLNAGGDVLPLAQGEHPNNSSPLPNQNNSSPLEITLHYNDKPNPSCPK